MLKSIPLHATVHISPWGLKFEFPEWHLVKDVVSSFNEVLDFETKIEPYEKLPWRIKKEKISEIENLMRRGAVNRRACLLSCFNLIEAYINGLAWDFVQQNDISHLSKKNRNVLTESESFVNTIDKLIKVPKLISQNENDLLHQTREPLKSFIEVIKPYRDAIVHASPFAASDQFGGYDKLKKLYELDFKTVEHSVEVTFDLIRNIHQYVRGEEKQPHWLPETTPEGKLIIIK